LNLNGEDIESLLQDNNSIVNHMVDYVLESN